MSPENSKKVNKSIFPAEGERRAIIGYSNQYKVSAYMTYQSLNNDNLKWIKIADPDAKQLDDFQISSGSRIDVYQIKWSQFPSSFTFNDLVKSKKSPSLISQLAEGWKHFIEIYPGKKIVVHLLTNNYPSTKAKIPHGEPLPSPNHFAAFIEQAWKPFKIKGEIPVEWKCAWDDLQIKSGLNKNEFRKFVRDCELEFEYKIQLPKNQREKEIFIKDWKDLTQYLFDAVADPSRQIKITRNELIERLKWPSRTEFRSQHEFSVNETLYHPIESNVKELNDALNDLTGGYIGVFGTPGSGKSTFLSHFLRSRKERVIFYYAYVPDSHDSIIKRGESENFLHDIVLALRHEGFIPGENLNLDLNQLLEYFSKQLNLLHEDWEKNGQKTIFLIDGLDHIEREQHPVNSLLKYLPLPESVPEGVYFILGSQTDTVLHDKIQYAVNNENRKIIMHPLSKNGVFDIINKAGLTLITGEQKERIFSVSDGHPLALSYILNHLRVANDEEEIDKILKNTEKYEEDIEAQYHSYWRQIDDNEDLIHLIGLLCRFRSYIDISWVKTWPEKKFLRTFIKKFMRYFRTEENRWYFFHNSFRLFLQEKTAELLPGRADPDQEREFHHEIAEKCSETKKSSYWSWEELYHRAKADEHQIVLEKASQSYFRDQFFNFRPIDAIKTDNNFALESAAICQDPVALTRLLLISSEIGEREVNLDKKSIISILLKLNEKEIAWDYTRDGNRLRIKPKDALKLIPEFKSAGLNEEAEKIFELSEPLNILYSPKPIENDFDNKKGNLIKQWASSAIYFKDIKTIIETIRQIKKLPDHTTIEEEDPSRSFQNWILYNVGLGLLKKERWNDLSTVIDSFNVDPNDFESLFYLLINSCTYSHKMGHEIITKRIFNNFQKKFENIEIIDYNMNIRLAESLYLIFNDKKGAENFIKNVPQPNVRTDLFQSGTSMNPFMYRFRLNRLLYSLGSEKTPEEIIPDPDNFKWKGIVQFERYLCILAKIYADTWENKKLDINIINEKIPHFFKLFYMEFIEARDKNLYPIQDRMGAFCLLIIETISQHGPEALKLLASVFEQQWTNIFNEKYWSADVRRQIIVALANNGVDHSWANDELKKIENGIWEGYNVYGRVNECLKQSKAWLKINEKDHAHKSLEKMFKLSFGIYHEKDYQLEEWIRWLDKFIEIHPERAEKLIIFFAEHIVLIKKYVDAKTYYGASRELLEVTFHWNSLKSIELSSWFMDHGVIKQEDIFHVFLGETLKNDNINIIPALFTLTNLLFPISQPNYIIFDLLLEKIYSKFGDAKTIEVASYLVSKVRIYAEKDGRYTWFYLIKKSLDKLSINSEDAGIGSNDIQLAKNDGFTYNLIELKDSNVLDENAVQNRVNSINDFVELLDLETEDSHFEWKPIINKLITNLNSKDLLKLSEIILKHENMYDYDISKLNSIISQKLSDNNDFKPAIDLGEELLKSSKPGGWGGFWTGMSRIEAFKALIKANKSQFRSQLYETLVNDIKNVNIDAKTVTMHLDEILSLLTDKLLLEEIWPEMKQHVHVLFENYPSSDFEPLEFNEHENVKNKPSKALISLLLEYLDHPAIFISQMAMHICANLLIWNEPEIYELIPKFMNKSEILQEEILKILEAASIKNPNISIVFQEELTNLCESENYLIQEAARNIIKNYDYSSYISESADSLLKEIQPEYFLESFYRIVDDEILQLVEKISEEISISSFKIWFAVYQKMDTNDSENPYWDVYLSQEYKYETLLKNLRINLPFKTPIEKITINSLHHVLGNLVKTNTLNNLELTKLYDPSLILLSSTDRPSEIELIDRAGAGKWVEELDFDKCIIKIKNRIVISEYSLLRYIDWENQTEIRQNTVHSSDYCPDSDLLFPIVNCLIDNYSKIKDHNEHMPLAIFGNSMNNNRVKCWLALNPSVAHKLGWKLSKNGLFRWINDVGDIMAESIWWEDGLVARSKPPFEKAGTGWIVTVSEEALKSIKGYYGSLERTMKIKRYFYDDEERRFFTNTNTLNKKIDL